LTLVFLKLTNAHRWTKSTSVSAITSVILASPVTDASGKLIPSNPSAKKPEERDQLVFQKSKSIFTIASKAFFVQARKTETEVTTAAFPTGLTQRYLS